MIAYGVKRLSLEEVMEGRDDFPVIRWMLRNGTHPVDSSSHKGNPTQIVRYPYVLHAIDRSQDEVLKEEALAGLLGLVERIIVRGRPQPWGLPGEARTWGACGGAKHYLGRDPVEDDVIIYRPLRRRDVSLRIEENPGGSFSCEWIVEFTLEIPVGIVVRDSRGST